MTHTSYPTFQEAIDRISGDLSLPATKRRDLVSALRRLSTYLNRPACDIPAHIPMLRDQIKDLHPVQLGIKQRTWANVKADVTRALTNAGLVPAFAREAALSSDWDAFQKALPTKHAAYQLSRLMHYANSCGIEPTNVTDQLMIGFRSYLNERLLGKDPAKLCKETIQTWNGIIRNLGLPYTSLSNERSRRYYARPMVDYPVSLQDEIDEYIDRLSHKDPFDEDGPTRALRPHSLKNIRAQLRQYLDGLVATGLEPAQMTSLRVVISAEQLRKVFTAMMARRRLNAPTPNFHNIASAVLAIANYHLKLPDVELNRIRKLKGRCSGYAVGMTAKNATRLGQFNNWENVARLISLPSVAMDRFLASERRRFDALQAMRATAINILLVCPMRCRNLARLDIDKHLTADRRGTVTHYSIRIPGEEVKNRTALAYELNAHHSKILHQYILKVRPLISEHRGTALFPRRSDGTPQRPGQIGQAIQKFVYDELGLDINPHLFRHLAAKLYLDQKPGEYETVRRILGHKKLQTTLDFYAELSNRWAHKKYDESVLSYYGGRNND